jgi:hypothetical protein
MKEEKLRCDTTLKPVSKYQMQGFRIRTRSIGTGMVLGLPHPDP